MLGEEVHLLEVCEGRGHRLVVRDHQRVCVGGADARDAVQRPARYDVAPALYSDRVDRPHRVGGGERLAVRPLAAGDQVERPRRLEIRSNSWPSRPRASARGHTAPAAGRSWPTRCRPGRRSPTNGFSESMLYVLPTRRMPPLPLVTRLLVPPPQPPQMAASSASTISMVRGRSMVRAHYWLTDQSVKGGRKLAHGRLKRPGAVAQLGEHLVCNQKVVGSIPIRSIRIRQAKPRSWT